MIITFYLNGYNASAFIKNSLWCSLKMAFGSCPEFRSVYVFIESVGSSVKDAELCVSIFR